MLGLASLANAGGDYSSPETTLAAYIDGLRSGDVARILVTFDDPKGGFNLPKPLPISNYRVTKRIVYGPKRVEKWNSQGIIPQARVGDVELQVLEIVDGKKEMYSYNFRKINGDWKMYSGGLWGAD
jgi:hypothetical protein